jgi:hypothetical protein
LKDARVPDRRAAQTKLVVLDASVDLAKKASEEAGAEVMVVMRSPDWALAHEEQNLPVSIGYSARLDG